MGRLIVVVFGLMGSGKSNRSRALAASLNWPVIHSDAVRKTLAGLKPTDRVPVEFGQGIYDEDFSDPHLRRDAAPGRSPPGRGPQRHPGRLL